MLGAIGLLALAFMLDATSIELSLPDPLSCLVLVVSQAVVVVTPTIRTTVCQRLILPRLSETDSDEWCVPSPILHR